MATWIAQKPAALRVEAVESFVKGYVSNWIAERRRRREDWRALHELAALSDRSLADFGYLRRDIDAVSAWSDHPTADLARIAQERRAAVIDASE